MRDIIHEILSRDATGAPCVCNGYADILKNGPTKNEIERRIYGKEFIVPLAAPEYWG